MVQAIKRHTLKRTGHYRTSTQCKARRTILYLEVSGTAVRPCKGSCVSGNIAKANVTRTGAARNQAHLNIVDIHIAVRCDTRSQCNIASAASIAVQRHLKHFPCACGRRRQRCHLSEGVEILRVGHYTHFDIIAGRSLIGRKTHL